jgi:hypothetical protein
MNKAEIDDANSNSTTYRVRLPGFVSDAEVGLGDAIRRFTSSLGIKPCSSCLRRAQVLNHWIVFTGRTR